MRKHWWARAFVGLTALWFLAFATDPLALHRCPMHEAMMGMSAAGAASPMADMSAHDHPGVSAEHGQSGSDEHQSHQCTCLGTSWCSGLAALPGHAPIVRASVLVVFTAPHRPAASFVDIVVGARCQPPAIGPPVLHTA